MPIVVFRDLDDISTRISGHLKKQTENKGTNEMTYKCRYKNLKYNVRKLIPGRLFQKEITYNNWVCENSSHQWEIH